MPSIYDEHSDLVIVYSVYEGTEINVNPEDCYYDFSDIAPMPSDFDLKTDRELARYLEDIVYEAKQQEADEWDTEAAVERNYLKQFYGDANYD